METWDFLDTKIPCRGCSKFFIFPAVQQKRVFDGAEERPTHCAKCRRAMSTAAAAPVPIKRCPCGNEAAELRIATVDAPDVLDYGLMPITEVLAWIDANADNSKSAIDDGEYVLTNFCSLLCVNISLSPMAFKR